MCKIEIAVLYNVLTSCTIIQNSWYIQQNGGSFIYFNLKESKFVLDHISFYTNKYIYIYMSILYYILLLSVVF